MKGRRKNLPIKHYYWLYNLMNPYQRFWNLHGVTELQVTHPQDVRGRGRKYQS